MTLDQNPQTQLLQDALHEAKQRNSLLSQEMATLQQRLSLYECNIKALRRQRDALIEREADALVSLEQKQVRMDLEIERANAAIDTHSKDLNEVREKHGQLIHKLKTSERLLEEEKASNADMLSVLDCIFEGLSREYAEGTSSVTIRSVLEHFRPVTDSYPTCDSILNEIAASTSSSSVLLDGASLRPVGYDSTDGADEDTEVVPISESNSKESKRNPKKKTD